MYDIVIIGGGIIGSAIAHQLAKYDLKTILLEKDLEVANGITKSNSAIIHAGYDPVPGTLKARFNARGNFLYGQLTKDLNVHFKRIGSITVATDDEEVEHLLQVSEYAKQNGVDIKMLSPEEMFQMEPNLKKNVKLGLYAPTAGILAPWDMVYAFLENAVANGLELKTSQKVIDIIKHDQYYSVVTEDQMYDTKIIINAAGHGTRDITTKLIKDPGYEMVPTRGEYYVVDRGYEDYTNSVIFPTPTAKGKGVLVVPTIHGNLLLGPTSEKIVDANDTAVTKFGLKYVKDNLGKLTINVPYEGIIRTFSGVRPKTNQKDFIIRELDGHKNFIELAGIESPGLASAPAIAEYVEEAFISKMLHLKLDPHYKLYARHHIRLNELNSDEVNQLIKQNPRYGKMVCNCEEISEQEIINFIEGPLGARTVDGIKRRARPGGGRCQGGFCETHVIRLLSEVLNIPREQVMLNNKHSNVLQGRIKVGEKHEE